MPAVFQTEFPISTQRALPSRATDAGLPAAPTLPPLGVDAAGVEAMLEAVRAHDVKTVIRSYAGGASLIHPLFGRLTGAQIGQYWQSFLDLTPDLALRFEIETVRPGLVEVQWRMAYTLHVTDRAIRIAGSSVFVTGRLGIIRQTDRLDLRDWSRQALGLKGLVLSYLPGWSGFIEDEMRHAFDLAPHGS